MNILILNWRDTKNPRSGGAEVVTLEHAKAWIKAGNTVTWFTASFPNSVETESIDGVKIVRQGNVGSVFLKAPIYYFKNKNKIDLVIDEIHGIPFFTPFYVRKPKIGFIHEIAGKIWDVMFPFPINIIGKALENIMFIPYKNVPFFTVSESTKTELLHAGIKDVTVIHNGITIKKMGNINKEKNPTFIFVSRLVKMKGVKYVIKAFSYLVQKDASAKLWIVGDGEKEYITELKNMVRKFELSDSIIFYGHVSEEKKTKLLAKAHILLHASIKEGWGLVVIEAASQKTPSVVYNSAGLRDSVIHGKTGIVLEQNTPELLAEESYALYSDTKKYSRMQQNAFEWANSLTWSESTRKSLSLLKRQ